MNRFAEGGKTPNIAIQLVLLQCCKTGCTFFVARFTYLKTLIFQWIMTCYPVVCRKTQNAACGYWFWFILGPFASEMDRIWGAIVWKIYHKERRVSTQTWRLLNRPFAIVNYVINFLYTWNWFAMEKIIM